MSEAPERIWVGNWLADVGETATWDMGEWRNKPWPTVGVVEYVRADRIEDLEAALDKVKREARNEALREAAQKAEFTSVDCSAPLARSREKAFSVACNEVARRILALMEDKNDE